MSLEARRNKQAAAAKASTSNTKTATTTEKKAGTKKTGAVSGSLRAIAIGRAYKEFEPILNESGAPVARSYYDPAAHFAQPIGKDVDKERVVNASTLIKHLNATVTKPIFGVPFRGRVMRMFVEGIADQILDLVEKGYKVKYPNLVVLQKTLRKARKARNPRTGDPVQVHEHMTMTAKAARSAKMFLRQAA